MLCLYKLYTNNYSNANLNFKAMFSSQFYYTVCILFFYVVLFVLLFIYTYKIVAIIKAG
jgi:hypothetical protein